MGCRTDRVEGFVAWDRTPAIPHARAQTVPAGSGSEKTKRPMAAVKMGVVRLICEVMGM